jgi:hypothetical protein
MKARAIALAVMVLGCAKTVPQQRDGPQLADARETPKPLVATTSGPTCPLAVPGTKLSFAPVSGGGSMLFSAPDDADLRDLRQRVRLLAEDHNRSAYRLAMIDLPYRAEMVPIPGGARLDLVTGIGNDTLELQRVIEMNGPFMLEGRCGVR